MSVNNLAAPKHFHLSLDLQSSLVERKADVAINARCVNQPGEPKASVGSFTSLSSPEVSK